MNPFIFPNRMSIICLKDSRYYQAFLDRLQRIMMLFINWINNYVSLSIYLSLDCKACRIFFAGLWLLFTIDFSNLIHCLNIESLHLYLLRAHRRGWRLRGCLLDWTRRLTFILLRCWNYWALSLVFLFFLSRNSCLYFWWFLAKSFNRR